jgi:hypothetical protein
VPQVLDVLADPSHPQLASKLRYVAAAITRQKLGELRDWFADGLLTHLLDILRALPDLGLSDHQAAEVCAAAAAGVSNIIGTSYLLTAPRAAALNLDALHKEASCIQVLRALVRYGLANPAATEQLPPGHEIHVEPTIGSVPAALQSPPTDATRASREFWTPWRVCMYTISERLVVANNALTDEMSAALTPAATPATFQRLLSSAIEHPAGEGALLPRPLSRHNCLTAWPAWIWLPGPRLMHRLARYRLKHVLGSC